MRFLWVGVLALAVGCSSGGGSTMTSSAQLAGTVYEVDGQNLNLSGVQVTLLETGERAFTDASGAFVFAGLRPGTYRLNFNTTLMALAMEGAPGDGVDGGTDGGDDGKDGVDEGDDVGTPDEADGDEFEDADGNMKVDVPDGGHVQCDVALENGKVKDFASDHEDGKFAWAKLHLTDAAELAGYHVAGAVKIAAFGDTTVFKLVVESLAAGDVIEVFLGDPGTSIGTATADADGRAELVLENSIPLGAPNLGELAGMHIQVFLSDSDLKLLVGEVPGFHEEHHGDDEPHDGAGDGGDKPGDGVDGSDDGDKPDGDGMGEGDGDGTGDNADEPGEGDDKPDGEGGGDGVK